MQSKNVIMQKLKENYSTHVYTYIHTSMTNAHHLYIICNWLNMFVTDLITIEIRVLILRQLSLFYVVQLDI